VGHCEHLTKNNHKVWELGNLQPFGANEKSVRSASFSIGVSISRTRNATCSIMVWLIVTWRTSSTFIIRPLCAYCFNTLNRNVSIFLLIASLPLKKLISFCSEIYFDWNIRCLHILCENPCNFVSPNVNINISCNETKLRIILLERFLSIHEHSEMLAVDEECLKMINNKQKKTTVNLKVLIRSNP
jgi:hypothetical protein